MYQGETIIQNELNNVCPVELQNLGLGTALRLYAVSDGSAEVVYLMLCKVGQDDPLVQRLQYPLIKDYTFKLQ